MNLHEYQGKQLFAEYGLPVSTGFAVDTPEDAAAAADKIGGDMWHKFCFIPPGLPSAILQLPTSTQDRTLFSLPTTDVTPSFRGDSTTTIGLLVLQ